MILSAVFALSIDVHAAGITPYTGEFTGLDKRCGGGKITIEEMYKKLLMPAYKCYLYSGMSVAATIGQAAQESGYGTTELATKHNNYWGMKCTKTDAGHNITHTPSGYYTDSLNSTDKYRAYPNAELAFLDRPYFFWESSYYPHIKAMLENGTCNTYQNMFSAETQKDWTSYCSADYRNTVTSLIKQNNFAFYKLDDEAYTVGLLIHLGLYKDGDPIMINGEEYYPGQRRTYKGQYITLEGAKVGDDGSLVTDNSGTTAVEEKPKNWMPDKTLLTYEQWKFMEKTKVYLEEAKEKKLSSFITVPGIIFGVLLILYGILLLLAYWIDLYNTFLTFSLVEFLTFGKCCPLSPEMYKQEGAWTDTGKRNITIRHVLFRVALCVIVGAVFTNMQNVYSWFYVLYLYITDLINGGIK